MKDAMTGPGPVWTVSQLLLRATNALAAELGTVVVEGEISSFHYARKSGHMYWTLKDTESEVRCVMFRSDNTRLTGPPEDGTEVIVVARPTIYPSRGQFQLQVTQLQMRGAGALHRQFELLRRKLSEEGLFDEARKRPTPFWPRTVGVVTSAEGAAVRDIVSVIRRRAASTRIVLRPVPVQGREAAPEIARAVSWFATNRIVDVLVVGRGGGSLEDLWAFNEEIVVRAIAESPIPTVSAVGHETDTTLADYAADVRAPTPSAAGVVVVPEQREIQRSLQTSVERLAAAIHRQRRRRVEEALAPIRRYGFRRVRDRRLLTRQRWGEGLAALRLPVAGRREVAADRLENAVHRLGGSLASRRQEIARAVDDLETGARSIGRAKERIETRSRHLAARLEAVSPVAILARGYAIVTDSRGAIVRDAATLARGDRIRARLARGELEAVVEAGVEESDTQRSGGR